MRVERVDLLRDKLPAADLVVAADVLYVPLLAASLGATLRARPEPGAAIITDPGRLGRAALLDAWQAEGAAFVDTWLPPSTAPRWRLGAADCKVGIVEVGIEALASR